eukprot:3174401-Heterocapsa_arctica.AAC.1
MALESCIKDAGAMWMNQGSHGDMTECIFAPGYLYQTKNCRALEGIMVLVVYLKNKLRASEHPTEIVAQQEVGEDLPVTRRQFHMAIDMLKDMNDILVQENLQEARRARNVVRDLSDTLLKVRARSPGSDDT